MSNLMRIICECIVELSGQYRLMAESEEEAARLEQAVAVAKKATALGAEYELNCLRREIRDISESFLIILNGLRKLEGSEDSHSGETGETDERFETEEEPLKITQDIRSDDEGISLEEDDRDSREIRMWELYQRINELTRTARLEMEMLAKERRELKEKKKQVQELIEKYSGRLH